ncbi:MAG: DUF412 family protein [Succinivibrionaceae bacterium]
MLGIKSFINGIKYAKSWPQIKILNNVFKEGWLIVFLSFHKKVAPPLLALFVIWYFIFFIHLRYEFSMLMVPSLFCIIAFVFLFPICSYYYLGVRSQQSLPPKMKEWYCYIVQRLGYQPKTDVNYFELMKVLKIASADKQMMSDILDRM